MALALAPHIHLAALGDDVVLLDTAADAYLCIPGGLAQLRPSPDRGSVSPLDQDLVAGLLEAGFVAAGIAPTERPWLPRPSRDIGEAAAEPLSACDAWRLAGALWDLLWRYRGRRLGDILAFVAAGPRRPARTSETDILRLARRFQTAVVWLPMPRKCLVRSFVLLRFLQRSGLDARWVFGVRTWPFAAHCWLQLGDMVLDDAAERLVAYEPILAVG